MKTARYYVRIARLISIATILLITVIFFTVFPITVGTHSNPKGMIITVLVLEGFA
jgi:hypothetical protein